MTKTALIIAALRAGAATSRDVARQMNLTRNAVSVALHRLADLGVVERAGVANEGELGRPFLKWRLVRR